MRERQRGPGCEVHALHSFNCLLGHISNADITTVTVYPY